VVDTKPTVRIFAQHAPPSIHFDTHALGKLKLRGSPAELHRQLAGDRIHAFLSLAHIARSPVQLAQAVQDGSLDPMFSVGLKGHIFRGIELFDRVHQSQNTGIHQIVQIHMHRQIFVYANSNRLNKREMIHHDLVSSLKRHLTAHPWGHTFSWRHTLHPHLVRPFPDCRSESADSPKSATLVPAESRGNILCFQYFESKD
jgi:hypothetical protein